METLSNKETALLGLLAEGQKHAYQIEKDVEERSMRDWTDLSMSSIYKLLRDLEARGMVSATVELGERNLTQKVYAISPAGLEALAAAVELRLSRPAAVRWELDLALYNLPAIGNESAIRALSAYIAGLRECEANYRALEAYMSQAGCSRHAVQVAIRPQYLYKADLEWALVYRRELEEEQS